MGCLPRECLLTRVSAELGDCAFSLQLSREQVWLEALPAELVRVYPPCLNGSLLRAGWFPACGFTSGQHNLTCTKSTAGQPLITLYCLGSGG